MPKPEYPGVYVDEVAAAHSIPGVDVNAPGMNMPKREYPGVYVEEVATAAHSIPGVDTSTPVDAARLQALVAVMRDLGIPPWTDANESDPGATFAELLAWLADQLPYRAGALPERLRERACRALAFLSAPGLACGKEDTPLLRPDFFAGRLLDAAALEAEQEYHRQKMRRHNLAAHGFGIVEGLGVRLDSTRDEPPIIVEPGYAIDRYGEPVVIPRSVELAAPKDGTEAFVAVRFWEHPCATDPAGAPCGYIEEAALLSVRAQAIAPWIALARITREGGRWVVDPIFDPPRARSVMLQGNARLTTPAG
jgi:hypothetical protein